MVEKFFKQPCTLCYLRGGVTGLHIDSFAAALFEQGFAINSGRKLLRGVAHLGHWMERQRTPLATLDESVLETFRAHLSSCRCVRRNRGQLVYCRSGPNRFLGWARQRGLVRAAARVEQLPPLVQDFETWMLRHRNVAPATLSDCYRLQLRRFIDTVGDNPDCYGASAIREFVLAQSQRTEPSRAKQAVTAVRMLLRYLAVTGLCSPELVDAVPTVAHWKLGTLPKYLSREVVEQIVASCDPATQTGRRDRSVLLLITRLGLRAGDVAALRLGDIDWSAATITVFGKGRREARLPLPQDVGDALLAWIHDGRPERDDDHILLRVRAPGGPLNSGSVAAIVARAAERAGVATPRVGPHVLRHSVATTLLREGLSLPAIGALLRHQSLDTTTIYAKVDVDLLGSVACPWPVEVSP